MMRGAGRWHSLDNISGRMLKTASSAAPAAALDTVLSILYETVSEMSREKNG